MRKRSIIVLGILALLVPSAAHARGGDMDYYFGRYGFANVRFGQGDQLAKVAVQGDSKILAVGTTYKSGYDFAVARFSSKGVLDKGFSGDGKTTVSFGHSDVGMSVAPAPGGKVVVAGSTIWYTGDDDIMSDFAIARFTSKGALDKTFSGDGKTTTDFFGERTSGDILRAMDVGSDGKIVVAGTTVGHFGASTPFASAGADVPAVILARYATDGSLDPTFGSGGKVVLNFGEGAVSLAGIDVRSDGSVVLAGTITYLNEDQPSDMLVARLTTVGSLDPTFGTGGITTTDFFGQYDGATAMATGRDGSIVTAGVALKRSAGYMAIARYTSAGVLDKKFSADGKATGPSLFFSAPSAVAVQSDGKVTVAGLGIACSKYGCTVGSGVTRFSKSGSIDKGYGKSGTAVPPIGQAFYSFGGGGSIALQSDRVILGTTGNAGYFSTSDFQIVRLQK